MTLEEFSKQFGTQLRRIRREAGVTQEELASRVGCDICTIGRIERAEKSPTLGTLFSIAAALQWSLSGLVDCEPKGERSGLTGELRGKLNQIIGQGGTRELTAAKQVMDGLLTYGHLPKRGRSGARKRRS